MSAVPDAASARRALAGLVDDGLGDDDVRRIYATAVWSTLVEPGDGVAGALIRALGAVDALETTGVPPLPAGHQSDDPMRCAAPELWASLSQKVVEFLDSVTLQKLVEDQVAAGVQLHAEAAKPVKKPLPGPVKPLLPNAPNSVFQLGRMVSAG